MCFKWKKHNTTIKYFHIITELNVMFPTESTVPLRMDSTPVSGTNVILEFTGVPLCGSSKDKCQERGRALQEAIMYRFLFRAAYTARNSSVSVYESCVLPAKCDKAAAPVFR